MSTSGRIAGFDCRAILRALADVNGATHPPLRVPPVRVLVLLAREKAPLKRKGEIWRKKLEAPFGERIHALVSGNVPSAFTDAVGVGKKVDENVQPTASKEEVEREVVHTIAKVLGVPSELIEGGEVKLAKV